MRTLLSLAFLAFSLEAAAQLEVATVGAPRELTRALKATPEVRASPLRGKARTLAQALRSPQQFELLIWVRNKGKSTTAELYSRSGTPLGFVKVTKKGKAWSAQSVQDVMVKVLVIAQRPPGPSTPVAEAPSVAPPEPMKPAAQVATSEPPALSTPAPLAETPRPPPAPAQHRPALAQAGPSQPAAPAVLDVPRFELSLGSDVVWRSYELCPGTLRCGRQVFTSSAGLRFVTEAPYLGGTIGLTSFPFQGDDSPLDGIGVEARYARRFIEVGVPSDAGLTWVPSYDEELWAELLYRSASNPFGLELWHGVRVGGGTRRFVSATEASSSSSLRGIGAAFGLDGGLALLGRWLRAEAGVSYVFGTSPGEVERAAYGGAVVGSDSLRGRATLSGTLPSGFGLGVSADYTLFFDSFFGSGGRTNGASAREEYLTVTASVRYRL